METESPFSTAERLIAALLFAIAVASFVAFSEGYDGCSILDFACGVMR